MFNNRHIKNRGISADRSGWLLDRLDPIVNGHPKKLFLNHVTVDPGCSIGDHPHDHETEFYYIIKGEGVFNDNGKEIVVRPGDICATGYGEVHGLENRGTEPVELIALIVGE